MAAARLRLGPDPRFVFARRAITRPAEAGGEDHEALTDAQFATRRNAGGFALWWEAHGLAYAIPRAIEDEMAAGRVVVANLSRAVLPDADRRYRLRVLRITAPLPVLTARLLARGREDAADIQARLAREVKLPPGLDIVTVMNDGPIEAGVDDVIAALSRAAADARPAGRARPAPPG